MMSRRSSSSNLSTRLVVGLLFVFIFPVIFLSLSSPSSSSSSVSSSWSLDSSLWFSPIQAVEAAADETAFSVDETVSSSSLDMHEENEEEDDEDNEEDTLPSSSMKEPAIKTPPVSKPPKRTIPFVAPSTEGLWYAETFQYGDREDEWKEKWMKSDDPKFTGPWENARRSQEHIKDDLGLKVGSFAVHHGISAAFPRIESNKGEEFLVQYEAKFEEDLKCGGAYLKLFDRKGEDLSKFNAQTNYAVMFGPDKCGSTNKVHFIIKYKNPVSGLWTEHQIADAPTVPSGKLTHLYCLWIRPDDSFEIFVDNKSVAKGNLSKDMTPPLIQEKEIGDPDDSMPTDWDSREEISDPNATKPDDFDEDAPEMIEDPQEMMPEGWLVDEPKMILDPEAEKPEDWDDNEDGEWTAPTIPNPKCSDAPGCGIWKAPMIKNPAYRGKWSPPIIPNPNYKGVWAPRKIPNPNYVKDENLHALNPMDSVGFELWTMESGILFDNIVISRNKESLDRFTEKTWMIRQEMENEEQSSEVLEDEKEKLRESEDVAFDWKLLKKMIIRTYDEHSFFVWGAGGVAFLLLILLFGRKSKKTSSVCEMKGKSDKVDAKVGSEKEEKSQRKKEGTIEAEVSGRRKKNEEEDEEEEEEEEEEGEELEDEDEDKPKVRRRKTTPPNA